MESITENTVLYDLMHLWIELERQPNAQAMRDILNEPLNNQKYRNVAEHGGKDFVTWLAKLMIAMKEKQNESHINNPNE
jgi:hypothetical protein